MAGCSRLARARVGVRVRVRVGVRVGVQIRVWAMFMARVKVGRYAAELIVVVAAAAVGVAIGLEPRGTRREDGGGDDARLVPQLVVSRRR